MRSFRSSPFKEKKAAPSCESVYTDPGAELVEVLDTVLLDEAVTMSAKNEERSSPIPVMSARELSVVVAVVVVEVEVVIFVELDEDVVVADTDELLSYAVVLSFSVMVINTVDGNAS
jgi:hypothetical protein